MDLTYPEELHDLHNAFPLAPEKMVIKDDMLSHYARGVLGGAKNSQCPKLVPNLMNKTKYIIHHENLAEYLHLGMKITKIHRAIVFDERDWLSEYIDFNTEMRKRATTDFERDFFKLMNNAVFG